MRNAQRWGMEDELPLERIVGFASQRFPMLERAMERLSAKPYAPVPFVRDSDYDVNNISIDEDS